MKTINYFLAVAITAITFLSTAQITSKFPLTVAVAQTNPSCNGMNDGEITLMISGGVQPYIVNGVTLSTSSFTMSNLTSGVYDFLIYDSYNGGAGGSITLTSPTAPSISFVIGNESNNNQDGLIELTVSPAPLSYQWQSTSTVLTNPNDEDQYNLSSGWYAVTITDINGCEYVKRFNVLQYMTPVINGNFVTGGQSNNTSAINVYPNPSNGEVSIDSKDSEMNYEIYNTNGQLIESGLVNGTVKTSLPKGTYYVHGIDNNNTTRSNRTLQIR